MTTMSARSFILSLTLLAVPLTGSAQDFSFLFKGYPCPAEKTDTVSLCFIGDVMMHSRQLELASDGRGGFDFSSYFSGIRDRLEAADLCVANMEFSLGGEPYSGYPCFSAPDAYAEYVADCGVDVFLTANNHILDRGVKGLERTLGIYGEMGRKRGIQHCGCGGHALLLPVKGCLVAIVNFTYGTNVRLSGGDCVNRMDEESVGAMLREAKEAGADLIVACPHWGEEYKLSHSPKQEKWARFLAENGADVIIGHHPHVVQDRDTLVCRDGRRVPVCYSIGNAVSNMSAANTQRELMVTLELTGKFGQGWRLGKMECIPMWCHRPGGRRKSYSVQIDR